MSATALNRAYLIKWTRYGRWSDDGLSVLNQYGGVIYKLPQPLELREAGMLGVQRVPFLSNQNQVAKHPLKALVNEHG